MFDESGSTPENTHTPERQGAILTKPEVGSFEHISEIVKEKGLKPQEQDAPSGNTSKELSQAQNEGKIVMSQVISELIARHAPESETKPSEVARQLFEPGEKFQKANVGFSREHPFGETWPTGKNISPEAIIGQVSVTRFRENLTEKEFRNDVEGFINSLEKDWRRLLRQPERILTLASEIETYTSNNIDAEKIVDLRAELTERLEAKLYLTLANGQAVFGQSEKFADTVTVWGRGGLEYIVFKLEALEDLRVKDAIDLLEANDGAYYRLTEVKAQEDQDETMVNSLIVYHYGEATPASKEVEDKAKKSLDYAKKVMVVTGQAGIWGGGVNPDTNKLIEMEIIESLQRKRVGRFAEGEVDMQVEDYWNEWDERRKQRIVRIPTTKPEDRARLRIVGHTLPVVFKNGYYGPEVLEEAGVGLESIRYLAEGRARSLAFYKHKIKLGDLIREIDPGKWITDRNKWEKPDYLEFIGPAELGSWSGIVKSSNDFLAACTSKEPNFLIVPMANPNQALGDPEKAFDSMQPFIKIGSMLDYLANYAPRGEATNEPFKARASKLTGLLEFMTTKEKRASNDRFSLGYRRWNDNLMSAATDDMKRIKLIRPSDYSTILEKLNYIKFLAMIENGFGDLGQGVKGFFLGLLRLFYQ